MWKNHGQGGCKPLAKETENKNISYFILETAMTVCYSKDIKGRAIAHKVVDLPVKLISLPVPVK